MNKPFSFFFAEVNSLAKQVVPTDNLKFLLVYINVERIVMKIKLIRPTYILGSLHENVCITIIEAVISQNAFREIWKKFIQSLSNKLWKCHLLKRFGSDSIKQKRKKIKDVLFVKLYYSTVMVPAGHGIWPTKQNFIEHQ